MGIGSTTHKPLGKGDLWGTPGLQLPAGLQHLAHALMREAGMPKGRAIATAVSRLRVWRDGGGKVKPETRAKAAKVLAELDAARAKAKATPNKGDRKLSNAGGHIRTLDLADGSAVATWQSDVTGRVVELARYVRTEAGAKRFGRPIGTLIERGGGRASKSSGDRGGSRSGGRAGGSSPRRSGAASGSQSRTDGRGKALPKGQRTGGDYVREGLARRQAAEERKRAKYEAQKDGQLRARQKAVAREWLAAKAAGTPATDRKQRERRAEVNALQAEIARRGQSRPQGAVGANATPADRLARMGEMERRAALRDMPDGDLKSARSELSARETSGKPSATKAAINAELERRGGGNEAAARKIEDSTRGTVAEEAGRRNAADLRATPEELEARYAPKNAAPASNAREQRADGPDSSSAATDDATARADAARKMVQAAQIARENAYRSGNRARIQRALRVHEQMVNEAADIAAGRKPMPSRPVAESKPQPRTGDKPLAERSDRELDGMQRRARDAVRKGDGGRETGRNQATASAVSDERNRRRTPPGAANTAGKPASDAPALSDRLRKLTDGQLAAMDDALSKKGGEPSERHRAIKAERARRAPGSAVTAEKNRADAATLRAATEKSRAARKAQSGPLDKPGGMDAARRAPAAPDSQARSANPARDAAPGAVAAPPKAPAGKDPGESARPGPGQSATPKPPGTGSGPTDPPASKPKTEAPKRPTRAPRTQGDDEDDALFAQSKARNEARRARGEKLPDPYADDQSTPPARPARATDAATGNRLQDYARADAAGRQQMVGSLSDAELNQLDGALGRAAERAPDDTVRSVLAGRRGEIDRERMRRRTAGMTDRPVAGSQDRQTPGDRAPSTTRLHMMDGRARNRAIGDMDDDGLRAVVADETSRAESLGKGGKQSRIHAAAQRELDKRGAGAPKVSTRDLLDRPASERRAAPAAIDAPRVSAPVAPPQATSRPAPPGSNRAPGRIPDNRGSRFYNMPDRPMGREQPTPQPGPAADGPGVGGGPNLSRLAELDDDQLDTALIRAQDRQDAAARNDPRRTGQAFSDAKLAVRALQDEVSRRRQQAPATPPPPGFNAAKLTVGDGVRLRTTQWRAGGDAEIVQERPDGYVVRTPDGREQVIDTADIEGPAGPAVPEQRGAPDAPFGPQNAAPPAPRTGSGTRRLNGAQIRALQAQLIRETDPERKAALRARIAAGQGRGAVTRQMSQAPGGREVELAMGGTKKRGMADMSDEQLDKAEKRAAGLARGRTGPAAARATQVMVAARGEKRRRKGSGASSAKSNRPPAFVKALSQPVELAAAVSTAARGTRVTTSERAAQIVGGTALGQHRYPRGA